MKSQKIKVLSEELRDHYRNHGVAGIEAYITKQPQEEKHEVPMMDVQQVSSTSSSSTTACNSSGSHTNSETVSCRSRFIRLNPRFDKEETLKQLQKELQQQHDNEQLSNECTHISSKIQPIPWLSRENKLDFYAIPEYFNLSRSQNFISGRIYGMDVSSGAAVAALLLDEFDVSPHTDLRSNCSTISNENESDSDFRVLDLCCAPGIKTCAIADLLNITRNDLDPKSEKSLGNVQIVGVDISSKRIQLCKNVIKKYHIDHDTSGNHQSTCGTNENHTDTNNAEANVNANANAADSHTDTTIQLYNTDGTTFGTVQTKMQDISSLVFDSNVALEQQSFAGKRKRMNKSARARERKRLKGIAQEVLAGTGERDDIDHFDDCSTGDGTKIHLGDGDGGGGRDGTAKNSAMSNSSTDRTTLPLFDRVLVDAECSTDGAVRHLQHKYYQMQCRSKDASLDDVEGGATGIVGRAEEGPGNSSNESRGITQSSRNEHSQELTKNSKLTDATKLQELVALQKKLIESGFRLLKPGGIMVYSTCSLVREQNEDVVSWLVNDCGSGVAEVIPVSFSVTDIVGGNYSTRTNKVDPIASITEGFLEGTVRFHPSTSSDSYLFGGGFFLAKIRKWPRA